MRFWTPAPSSLARSASSRTRSVTGSATTRWCPRCRSIRMTCRSVQRDTPTHAPPYPDTEDVTEETYGPLKVACEAEAAARFGDRLLVIRPGYIVGPHDPTDRFTWWVRRAAAGGEMLAAGPADAPTPGDRRARPRRVRPRSGGGTRLRHVRRNRPGRAGDDGRRGGRRAERGGRGHLVRVGRPGIRAGARAVETWFPIWHPHLPGFHAYDAAKAVAAGLRPRPFDRTIADTLASDRNARCAPLAAGVPPDRKVSCWTRGGLARAEPHYCRSRGVVRSHRRSAISSSPS